MFLVTCNDRALSGILYTVKNVIFIIQLAVPIMLIIWASIELFKLMMNPDEKKGIKSIINKFIAAVVVFMIPVFVNVVMGLVGESTNFSSCWKNAEKITGKSTYIPIDDGKKNQKIIP